MRELADWEVFNEVLEAIAAFREVHYGWAQQYIQDRVADPRGTGGILAPLTVACARV